MVVSWTAQPYRTTAPNVAGWLATHRPADATLGWSAIRRRRPAAVVSGPSFWCGGRRPGRATIGLRERQPDRDGGVVCGKRRVGADRVRDRCNRIVDAQVGRGAEEAEFRSESDVDVRPYEVGVIDDGLHIGVAGGGRR